MGLVLTPVKKKIQFNNHPTWRLVVTRGGNLIWQRVKGNKLNE